MAQLRPVNRIWCHSRVNRDNPSLYLPWLRKRTASTLLITIAMNNLKRSIITVSLERSRQANLKTSLRRALTVMAKMAITHKTRMVIKFAPLHLCFLLHSSPKHVVYTKQVEKDKGETQKRAVKVVDLVVHSSLALMTIIRCSV